MSARKKWKVTAWPIALDKSARSEAEAYRIVRAYRDDWLDGRGRVNQVTVFVDEGTGAGWATFERIRFQDEVSR